jgi:hypothetical protein
MQELIGPRLEALRVEHERGHRHLELLERQRRQLLDRLLRIEGAIQVLEALAAGSESGLTADHAPT